MIDPATTARLGAASLVALALAGCERDGGAGPAYPSAPAPAPSSVPEPANVAPTPIAPPADLASRPPVEPPAPGAPGGLPDDRTPVSEAPFTAESAQGAADVLQTYFALIGEQKFTEAYRLWGEDGAASGRSEADFVTGFEAYRTYNAQIGAPGRVEGAAGSLYVEVPVVIYGRRMTGEEVRQHGTAQLRRVHDVPGSTPEQRRWRIVKLDLQPSPAR